MLSQILSRGAPGLGKKPPLHPLATDTRRRFGFAPGEAKNLECLLPEDPVDINELTFRIRRAVFQVNKLLGSGFLEKVYENALLVELRDIGLKAEEQVPVKVRYKGREIGEYFADIVVENQVILELKAIECLQKVHEAQLLNYLKATGYKIGLLINFTYPKAQIKRFIL